MVSNCAGLVNIARDRLMDVSISEMVGLVVTSPESDDRRDRNGDACMNRPAKLGTTVLAPDTDKAII